LGETKYQLGLHYPKINVMKIAWYTPYSQESAIGRFSEDVVASFVEASHEVCIVRTEYQGKSKNLSCRHSRASQIVWAEDIDAELESFLTGFDYCFFNIGDNFQYHAWAIPHQRRCPGITILHDFFLHNLLAGWSSLSSDPFKVSYETVLRMECGLDACVDFRNELEEGRSQHWFSGEAAEHTVLSFAVPNTLGIVTHSGFYAPICSRNTGVPVATIPLSYRGVIAGGECSRDESTRRTIITVGNANINKCYHHVIRAIGESPELAKSWHYRIVGHVTDDFRSELESLANSSVLPVSLSFSGRVNDENLRKEYRSADAVACLRNPVLEGASASVIESLQNGLPTIVSKAGCYDEIPDNLVFKVEHGTEQRDLTRILRFMNSKASDAKRMGTEAAIWANWWHHPKQYVAKLLEFALAIEQERSVLALVARLANHMRPMSQVVTGPWQSQIAEQLDRLFPSSQIRSNEQIKLLPLSFTAKLEASCKVRVDEGIGVPAYYCRKRDPSTREPVAVNVIDCHKLERNGNRNCFWTKGVSTLEFSFSRSCLIRWAWIEVVNTGPIRKPIVVRMREQYLGRSSRKRKHWIRVRIPSNVKASKLTLVLETKSFTPSNVISGSEDDRELGIAIGSIYFAKYWWRFTPRLESAFSSFSRSWTKFIFKKIR